MLSTVLCHGLHYGACNRVPVQEPVFSPGWQALPQWSAKAWGVPPETRPLFLSAVPGPFPYSNQRTEDHASPR